MLLFKQVLFDTRGPDIDRDVTPILKESKNVKEAAAHNRRAAIALEATIEEFLSENAKARGDN